MVNPRDVSPGVDDASSPTRILGEDDFIIASSPMTWGMDRSCQPRHSHARAGVNQETVIFDDSDSGIIKIFADFLSFCIFLPGNFGHAAFIVRLFIFVFLSETGMWHIYDVLGWGGWIHNPMLWALVALTWGYTGLYAYGVE